MIGASLLLLLGCGEEWQSLGRLRKGPPFELGDEHPTATFRLSVAIEGEAFTRMQAREPEWSRGWVEIEGETTTWWTEGEWDRVTMNDVPARWAGWIEGGAVEGEWAPFGACEDLGDCVLEREIVFEFTRVSGEATGDRTMRWWVHTSFLVHADDGDDHYFEMDIEPIDAAVAE